MNKIFYSLALLCVIWSCVPEVKKQKTIVTVDRKHADFKKINDFIAAHQVDSLMPYLNHEDPTFRFLAVNAFSSLKSEIGQDSLLVKMDDIVLDVRAAAAYALGQQYNESITDQLIGKFKNKDTSSVDNEFNANILEAVGKMGDQSMLEALSTVSSYRQTDTLLLLAQARGIYRYALRGIVSESGTKLMVDYTTDGSIPDAVRLMSAHYLSRARDLDLSDYQFRLSERLSREPNVNIRMAIALALRKTNSPDVLDYLKAQFAVEDDYRVKCNILRAYAGYDYSLVKDEVLKALSDENTHVANTAANYLINNGSPNDAMIYINYADAETRYEVKAKIYAAVFKNLPHYYTNSRSLIRKKVVAWAQSAEDPYEQAACFSVLGQDPASYRQIAKKFSKDLPPVVNSTLALALKDILQSEIFDLTHKSRANRVRKEILDSLKSQLIIGDPGVAAVIGVTIANPNSKLKPIIEDTEFLRVARARIKLPAQVESYNELSKAIAYLDDIPFEPRDLEYDHRIDWRVLDRVTDSTEIVLKTNKGNIKFKPYASEAPQSVANFLELSNRDFYDGRVFHRVVPNFVVQAGCPRGDGYGSLDYVINSELSQNYYDDEGYVGMASAGNHTEGTQWFITHSPTPHLDGKYTIFGKVTEGMDVVHNIQVGDKIVDVIITNQ